MSCQLNLMRIIYIWGFAIVLSASSVLAQNEIQEEATGKTEDQALSEPTETISHVGEGSFYLGFRLVDLEDSSKAAEYVEDESSLVLGMDTIAYPLPNRYHLHGEYLSTHDYYADFGYAYKDFVLFKDVLVGVHHNLDHYNYLYPGDPPSIVYNDRNVRDNNFINFVKNDLLLRVKAPDYPFHTFLKYRYLERDGAIGQRFMNGHFGNLTKISETRDIDWKSNDVILGLNSHLGPVEIEYAYSQGEFDPGNNNVLYDYFPGSFISAKPADIYPHNVIPETETLSNSLKFHTSYTGQIVASATFSNRENTNNYSNTEAELWKAAFDLRWIPDPVVSVFFKYRHKDEDKDNPEQVTLRGQSNLLTYPVRPLVSTKKDMVMLSARYRPMSNLTLIGKYGFEHRERQNLDEWELLDDKTDIHRLNLTAHSRPMDTLKLKVIYDHLNYDNPSYNTEPDYLNKIRLNATYTPVAWLTALFDYSLTLQQRDDLRYHNSIPNLTLNGGERDGRTDQFLASISFVFSPDVTLTGSWSYNRWKVEQDLAYALWSSTGPGGGLPYYDRATPYTDTANTFVLSLYYQLRKDLSLTADLNYTIAKGEYEPDAVIQGDPSALASFSSMETAETIFTIGLAKKIFQDWEVGLKFYMDIYNDKFTDDASDHQDGELYTTTLMLKRYF